MLYRLFHILIHKIAIIILYHSGNTYYFMHENHRRSVVKALSWRVIATMTTMVAVYFITEEWLIALEVGAIEATAKLFFYYLHERTWLRIKWGR